MTAGFARSPNIVKVMSAIPIAFGCDMNYFADGYRMPHLKVSEVNLAEFIKDRGLLFIP